MAVNIIEGGSGNVIKVQQRSDKSAQRNVLSEKGEYDIIIPRFIYSKLGNLTNQKSITLEKMKLEKNEYQFFMMELNRLFETGEDIDNIVAMDKYLGELGVEVEYPYSDDTYSSPPIYEVEYQDPIRNVINRGSGFSGEDENVVADINGVTYNVIHKT